MPEPVPSQAPSGPPPEGESSGVDVGAALSRQIGPLKAWQWGVVIGGGYLLFRVLTGRGLFPQGGSSSGTVVGSTSGDAGGGGGGGSSGNPPGPSATNPDIVTPTIRNVTNVIPKPSGGGAGSTTSRTGFSTGGSLGTPTGGNIATSPLVPQVNMLGSSLISATQEAATLTPVARSTPASQQQIAVGTFSVGTPTTPDIYHSRLVAANVDVPVAAVKAAATPVTSPEAYHARLVAANADTVKSTAKKAATPVTSASKYHARTVAANADIVAKKKVTTSGKPAATSRAV